MYKEYEKGQAPEVLERLATRIRAADAFIIVSGEYNHSIPPALSNLLDHFLEEYFWRPSAIVCYSAGTSAAFAPRCNCARCSASLARQAFRRSYRYRACRRRSMRKAILETNPTTSAGAVPERARVVRSRTQDRKAGGCSLLNRDLHAHET